MSSRTGKTISIIGVPMDLGADLRGVDMGPSAIRIAGVGERLGKLGYRIVDLGNVGVPHANIAEKGPARMKYVASIRVACLELADAVERALLNRTQPLVLGGDHSIALGTLAGLARFGARSQQRFGLLWVDAHGDCNTAATTPSGNVHGMVLAMALGAGERSLVRLAGENLVPIVDPQRTVLFGVRDLDPGERKHIHKLGIRCITMREIDEHGVFQMMHDALAIVSGTTSGNGAGGFHVSFDIDSLDPRLAPGVGTPVPGGLTMREGHLIMELIADTKRMVSCELVEVNPVFDHANATAKVAVDLLESVFGARIL